MASRFQGMRRTAETTIAWYVLARFLINILRQWRVAGTRSLLRSTLDLVFSVSKTMVPGVSSVVDKEVSKELAKIESKMLGDGDSDALLQLPEDGLPAKEICGKTHELRKII